MNNKYYFLLVAMLMLAVVQFLTTDRQFVTNVEDDQLEGVINRPKYYPFAGYKFESSPVMIGYNNWRKNLWENLNINLYFFGGHPVERDIDSEKLPFWLLPIALIGLYVGKEKKWFIFLSIVTFLLLCFLSLWGNKSIYGPIVTYPFWVSALFIGTKKCLKKI